MYPPTPEQVRFQELEAAERERECVSRSQIRSLAPRDAPPPSEEVIKARSENCFADPDVDRFAMAALDRSYYDLAATPAQVSAMKVPMLAIVGNQDSVHTRILGLKELRPDVKLVVVVGATHGGDRGIVTRQEFIVELRRFIAAAPAPQIQQR